MNLVDLNTRRWQLLEALFDQAIHLSPDLQASFLDRETASDPELRRQLLALLHHDTDAGSRIAQAIGAAAKSAATPVDWTGHRFGPYRILREIGRGGMGMVFLAVRDDDEYHKSVALKIAPWWRDLDLLRDRFRHERQILAALEHPNIARFLDGGTHDGIPYFAMEYVEGSPITEHARALPLAQKINLFQQVCTAVQYAHQNLLVHRDLKPANILVNAEGTPKLLDFGIAKLLSPSPDSPPTTLTGTAPWTPDYASPEQVRALPITTRTDIYSLGLILFELLTGQRAQTAGTLSPLALDRSICETETPRPSTRAPRAIARQLSGDLDTIVEKATHKEPERRYVSVAALSDDLARYLKGMPVEARPSTLAYRALKLVRRHRVSVTAALLVTISISAGLAATIHQARRAGRRFQQVRTLANSVLFDVPDRLAKVAGATQAREFAVRTALDYLDDLAKDAGSDISLSIELAAAYLRIGDVQGYTVLPSLGHREDALQSYRKARAILESIHSDDPKVSQLLARSHQRIGALMRALGQPGAIEEFRRALAAAGPADSELLATILIALGQAEASAGNVAEAARVWLRAADVNPRLASSTLIVRAHMYAGDLEAAQRTARDGIRAQEALVAADPANAAYRRGLMNAYLEFAYTYFHPDFLSYGDGLAAMEFHKKALVIARELSAADPSNQTAQSDLALAESEACAALTATDPVRALTYCNDALAIAARFPTQLSAEPMLSNLAETLHRLGRNSEALEALRNAIEIRKSRIAGGDHPSQYTIRQRLVAGYNQLGRLLQAMGDAQGALEQHRQALSLAQELSSAIPSNPLARRDLHLCGAAFQAAAGFQPAPQ